VKGRKAFNGANPSLLIKHQATMEVDIGVTISFISPRILKSWVINFFGIKIKTVEN